MTDHLTRAASVSLASFDSETREVDAVLATETPVRRRDWELGEYEEVLVVSPSAIDQSRMQAMSLLDSHDSWGVESRLGTVLPGSLRFEGKTAIVRIKLSRNAKAEALYQDLVDGHHLPVSVGYSITKSETTAAQGGKVATLRATQWTPMELSIVAVPADPSAVTRKQENRMSEVTDKPSTNDKPARLSVGARRTLINDLAGIAGRGFAETHADRLAELLRDTRGMTEEEVREEFLEFQVELESRAPTFPHITMRGGQDSQETRRKLVANAMLHRGGFVSKLEDGANEYRGMSVIDICRSLLISQGETGNGAPSEVLSRSLHSTSDFPAIMAAATNSILVDGYRSYQNTFQLIAHRNFMQDLLDVKVLELGSAPDLEPINEKGEYKRGTMKESEEALTMAHYGKVIGFTEAMIINDQFNAFGMAIKAWVRKAAKLEGDLVWNVIISNAKLKSDNTALFHANHNNLMTASALSKDSLVAARKMFRLQKDIDGNPIDMAPTYLFTGTDNEVLAQTLTGATTTPATPDQAIPQAIRSMTPVYENRLDNVATTSWFLFAGLDDTMGRGLQYSLLAGQEQPRMIEKYGFDYDGVEFRLDHYFGAGVTDFRFGVKNVGA